MHDMKINFDKVFTDSTKKKLKKLRQNEKKIKNDKTHRITGPGLHAKTCKMTK